MIFRGAILFIVTIVLVVGPLGLGLRRPNRDWQTRGAASATGSGGLGIALASDGFASKVDGGRLGRRRDFAFALGLPLADPPDELFHRQPFMELRRHLHFRQPFGFEFALALARGARTLLLMLVRGPQFPVAHPLLKIVVTLVRLPLGDARRQRQPRPAIDLAELLVGPHHLVEVPLAIPRQRLGRAVLGIVAQTRLFATDFGLFGQPVAPLFQLLDLSADDPQQMRLRVDARGRIEDRAVGPHRVADPQEIERRGVLLGLPVAARKRISSNWPQRSIRIKHPCMSLRIRRAMAAGLVGSVSAISAQRSSWSSSQNSWARSARPILRNETALGLDDHDHLVRERFFERNFERIIRFEGGMDPIGMLRHFVGDVLGQDEPEAAQAVFQSIAFGHVLAGLSPGAGGELGVGTIGQNLFLSRHDCTTFESMRCSTLWENSIKIYYSIGNQGRQEKLG